MAAPINYDPNTPTRKLSFADWQIQFIQNFTQLNTAFSRNHVPLDDPTSANRGNHTVAEMVEQTSDAQTSANELSLFVKDVEGQTDQICLTYPGNSPVAQITGYQLYPVKPTAQQVTNFTYLPGRMIMYFGTFGPYVKGPQEINVIKLNPPIAKNIISVQFAVSGDVPEYTPSYTIAPWYYDSPTGDTGYITSIFLIANPPKVTPNASFYMVLANI